MAYQFDINNDSPEIAYFPFVNLEPSANVSAGWQLSYTGSGVATSPGQVGVGTSYHYTNVDGASLLINWNGTGINLSGSFNNALYTIDLDGVPTDYSSDPSLSRLASFANLQNTNHSLLLTTMFMNSTSPDDYLMFDKASITYIPPPGSLNATPTSQAISDSDIAFMGQWSYETDTTGISMHVSNYAGDSATTTFSGSAITIYGLTSSYSGNFSVTLDNITTTLTAQSSYNDSDTLLFYATDLQQTVHYITVTNQQDRTLALRAGGMNITSFGNATTTPTTSSQSSSSGTSIPAGTIAAVVLGAALLLVILGILYYVYRTRRSARTTYHSAFPRTARSLSDQGGHADIEQVTTSIGPPSGEELESASLSTSKGYGFGLGLRRALVFPSRKAKTASVSTTRSPTWTIVQQESYPMTPKRDRDEKRLSIFTLTENLANVPESEKLAPGWSYPVARSATFLRYSHWEEAHGISLPVLHADGLVDYDGDGGDVKTLMSRQDETIAATLALSPRTAERVATDETVLPKLVIDAPDSAGHSGENQQPEFLQVRNISPFKVDVSAILATRKASRDSRRTSESGSSTWSKVRSRLYRRAHRDDGRQSYVDRRDTSSSSGPESVPIVMHESAFPNPPSETVPGSGTYSFLDLTSSHPSLRLQSKTTLSSTPAELGHSASEDTSIKMVRIEGRDEAPKPDAPSTASGGSHPSDHSGTHTAPSAPTTHTHTSTFPFPLTVPPSSHIARPSDHVPERHMTPSPPPPSDSGQYLQVPQIASPGFPLTPANSPTESVPFSVSEIHFRHSFSDHAGLESQRASVASVLPPHPPLPYRDSSQASTPMCSPPPPYIVQRVLGLSMSPISPLSPMSFTSTTTTRIPLDTPTHALSSVGRPGTAPIRGGSPVRVGSLLGPRPRPVVAGAIRGTAAPQLPMQGGRSNFRSPR